MTKTKVETVVSVYYDDRARNGKGAWRHVVKESGSVKTGIHHRESEARSAVGWEGGSDDPDYRG